MSFRRTCVRLLLALSTVLCAGTANAAEPPWLEVHSTHFTVITDAGEKRGREVALRFEQMRSVFALLLGKERLNQSVPLTILAFKNDKSYYQVAPLRGGQPIDVPGFFLPGEDQDFIVLNLSEDGTLACRGARLRRHAAQLQLPAGPGMVRRRARGIFQLHSRRQ